jgi:hypothetical protein
MWSPQGETGFNDITQTAAAFSSVIPFIHMNPARAESQFFSSPNHTPVGEHYRKGPSIYARMLPETVVQSLRSPCLTNSPQSHDLHKTTLLCTRFRPGLAMYEARRRPRKQAPGAKPLAGASISDLRNPQLPHTAARQHRTTYHHVCQSHSRIARTTPQSLTRSH